MKILWFKKNLRTLDNPLLTSFKGDENVVGVYFFEPSILASPDFSNFHLQFTVDSIVCLQKKLSKLHIPLIILEKDARKGFEFLASYFNIHGVVSHEETGNSITYKRDLEVLAWCKKNTIPIVEYPTNGIVRRLKSRNIWTKIWNQRISESIILPQLSKENKISRILLDMSQEVLASIESRYVRNAKIQLGGEDIGLRVFQSFLNTRSKDYISSISSPEKSVSGCSRLSAYITYGNISVKYIFQKSELKIQELQKIGDQWSKNHIKNIRFFLSRIHWQSHFIQKLEDEPEMEWNNVNKAYNNIRTQENTDILDAIFEGRSGIPFIDGIIRCLIHTGWINFRARATLVSFICNTCMQPWQSAAPRLARLFTDYEPGIHYPQFQMQAGTTGMNTIRIYNPIKQALEKDQDGRFIKSWIPELSHLSADILADPTLHPEGLNYPGAIISVIEANREARILLWGIKKKRETRKISAQVFEKHGSRVLRGKKKKVETLQTALF